MLSYCLLGLLCLSGISAEGPKISEQKQESHLLHKHSCTLNQGTVCIPTACSSSACTLFKNATCIADRCGCEARFFRQMSDGKTFQDVTKMCSSGNFVINYINYTTTKENQLNDEDPNILLTFFKEFNLLVSEIVKDIADYLQAVTRANPTQANVERLKLVIRTLSSLKRTARDNENDRVEEKFIWPLLGSLLINALKDTETGNLTEGSKTQSSIGKKFKSGVAALKNVISEHGEFYDVVQSGHVAISDKDAQANLQSTIRKICKIAGKSSELSTTCADWMT